ncbi:Psd2 [Kluyveromyces lactis]|nr:Psd2 [Kluyveromyces lactis]
MPRLLRRKRGKDEVLDVNHSRNSLTLQVQVHQARNFTINEAVCNPLCLVTFNNVTKTTKKVKNSTQPQWKSTLKLKLSNSPLSQYLRFIIYDSDNTNFLYLAECKISILTLFRTSRTHFKFTKDAQWYPMFNRNILREKNLSWMDPKALPYNFGELQLSFKLTSSNNDDSDTLTSFHLWNTKLMHNVDYEIMKKGVFSDDVIEDELDFQDVLDENDLLDVLKVDDLDQDMELVMDISNGDALSADEEGDIMEEEEEAALIEDPEIFDTIGAVYGLDTVSLSSNASVSSSSSSTSSSISETPSISSLYSVEKGMDENLASLNEFHIYNGFDSTPSFPREYSTPNESSASLTQDQDGFRDEDDKKLLSRRRKRIPKRKRSIHSFEVSKREHSLGVVVMTLKSITNLPLVKKKMSKTGYDMDPFVIITFGRRVFKSSYKRHTLNPEYNEVCAFEVYPEERHFELVLKVLDKDAFSFHDKIATASISWTSLVGKYQIGEIMNIDLPLNLNKTSDEYNSVASLNFQFLPYSELKRHFWTNSLDSLTTQKDFDIVELGMLLEQIGQFTSNEINEFFHFYNKVPWSREKLTISELVVYLENWTENNKTSSPFNNIQTCPLCGRKVHKSRNVVNSKLNKENDLIAHFAICQLKRTHSRRTFLTPSYVSINSASRRWFSKFLIKLTYGKYALGSNNANILVQDRDSGIIIEEKISAHVKVGIRIIYNGKGVRSKKFKNLLRKQTIKQGRKFDAPSSVKYIPSFIRFHSLDMSECLEVEYKSFNDFFYRKLKPGSRIPESTIPGILLSPADCRATVFPTVHKAQEIWIKGRQFSVSKLLGDCPHKPQFTEHNSSIAIFRLAPQDYHRFHAPCDGIIGKVYNISGEYYTVNPMAIRTKLDVFGENIRCIVPITSPEFGTILYIAVGAMMVGSIILTCKEGDTIIRGQEMGYFKFGGSTIIVLVPHQKIFFDSDLIKNSDEMVETLLKVGMSVGHIPTQPEHPRIKKHIEDKVEIERIKRIITVTDENVSALGSVPWEYDQLKNLSTS